MMLELLGSIIISQNQTPKGPPYYPSHDKPAAEQGYSNCVCGPHPQEGETKEIDAGLLGNPPQGKIVGLEYRGNEDHFVYKVKSMNGDPETWREGLSGPYGCYEIVSVPQYYIAAGGGFSGGVPSGWLYYQAPTPMNQPGCLNYDPPCPTVRIQGMPGQTIRIRCKSANDCTTNGLIPKGQ